MPEGQFREDELSTNQEYLVAFGVISLFALMYWFFMHGDNASYAINPEVTPSAAVGVLGIDVISTIFAKVLEFGGGILVGVLILIIGNILSTIAYNKLSDSGSDGLANIARIAILSLVLAMGLKAMGLADNIVNMAFGFTLGAVAIAAALAFGLGGKDAAKTVADRWANKLDD